MFSLPTHHVRGNIILSFWENATVWLQKPPMAVRTNFFRLLAVSQMVGLGLRESLISIAKSENNVVMKTVIEDMIIHISEWENLSIAMEQHPSVFQTTEIELIKAAQTMGNLPNVLKELAGEMESYQKITAKIKWSLMYPAALIVFAIAAVIILVTKVVPTIVALFPDTESLPGITKFTLSVSWFVIRRWFALLVGSFWAVITYQFLYVFFIPLRIFIDGLVLKIPIIKDAIRTFYMYRFAKLLGDFLRAGVDPMRSLSHIAKIFSNFFYQKKMIDVRNDLNAWFTFADAIEWSVLFDPILVQIIVVGEQTGNLGEILQTMAEFYKEQLMQKITSAVSLIEPILMGLIAIIIGSIVASVFLPLADLVSVIGQ